MSASVTPLTPTSTSGAVAVHFTPPGGLWLKAQPRHGWKLRGAGAVVFLPNRIELRGLKGRIPGLRKKYSLEIPLADIQNVVSEGRVVQCHVRMPHGPTKVLRLWASDAAAAAELAARLPQTRTPDFEQRLTEQQAFQTALQNINARSVVTPTLVALNCLVFVCAALAGAGVFQPNAAVLIDWGTNFGPLTLGGQWWRLFTSVFLHFGVLHLALNMWALWSQGRITERLFGSAHFALLYVCAGLCGSITSLLWHPAINSAGASGAIFGVLGGQLAFALKPNTGIPASISGSMKGGALVFVAYNLANGFGHTGIDNGAHIGGLLGGFAMGWLLARPLDATQREGSALHLVRMCLGALVALIALSWPLTHPSPAKAAEFEFRRQFQAYTRDEERIVDATNTLYRRETEGKITRPEWGRRMEKDILPQWQAAEARLASARLPTDSVVGRLQARLIDYLDERRSGLTLLSQAEIEQDPAKVREGMAILEKNKAHETELVQLLKTAY